MFKAPKVSVIMPIHNSARFLYDSISSVVNQTLKDWELLLIIDKSEDGSKEICEKFYKENLNTIRIMETKGSEGAARARNIGIEEARADYIAFLDSDDLWCEDKLLKQIQFMEKTSSDFSYHNYNIVDEKEELKKTFISPPTVNYETLLKDCNIGTLSVIYNAKKIGKIYMPPLAARNDFATWLKVLKVTSEGLNVGEVLASYRVVSGSLSSNKFKMLYYQFLLFNKYEKLSVLKSLYLVFLHVFVKIRKFFC